MYEDKYGFPVEPKEDTGRRSRVRGVSWGCFAAVIAVTLLFVLVIAFGWSEFVSFGVSSDITEFIQVIRESELDSASKQPILDRLSALRESSRRGKRVGFWAWLDYDESIRRLIEDGGVTEADLGLLAKELDSIESILGLSAAQPSDGGERRDAE